MTESADRRAVVLDQAYSLFTHYGYSRVTMDDIARESGMSRPAVYQYFRNKADIYRALAQSMLDRSLDTMASILALPGDRRSRIERAIVEGIINMTAEIESTAHGAELLDMKSELCSEIFDLYVAAKRDMLTQSYGEAVTGEKPEPAMLATHLSDWLEGMKLRVGGRDAQIAALAAFLDVQFAAIAHLAGSGDPDAVARR